MNPLPPPLARTPASPSQPITVETYGAKEHPESLPALNGFQLYLASLLPALDQGGAVQEDLGGGSPPAPLITAPGDYGVRGKVADFGWRVAGFAASLDCLFKNARISGSEMLCPIVS